MNMHAFPARAAKLAVFCLAAVIVQGCHKAPVDAAKDPDDSSATRPAAAATTDEPAKTDKPGESDKPGETDKQDTGAVTLSHEQVQKIGLKTAAAKATSYSAQTAGYGAIIPHEAIAQAVAELATAEATAKLSRSALARTKRLAGTAGALSADVEETDARQAAVDTAALTLAKQRLSATYGQKSPWSNGENQGLLQALANGSTQLVRVTFPLGALSGEVPKTLSAAHIGAAASGPRWKLTPVWAAPADATVPGRSFFAALHAGDAGEGERIIVWAPMGAAQSGVLVPADAVVIKDGKYWCYIETQPGTFARTEIDAGKPFEDGYFVTVGVKVGDPVVVTAVAQLLAQESNAGPEAD